MSQIASKVRNSALSAVDLLVDALTLGEYGLGEPGQRPVRFDCSGRSRRSSPVAPDKRVDLEHHLISS